MVEKTVREVGLIDLPSVSVSVVCAVLYVQYVYMTVSICTYVCMYLCMYVYIVCMYICGMCICMDICGFG